MRPDDITADIVRQALGAIRSARPLVGSPLLGLDALAEASAALPAGGTSAARTTFLRGWLEGIAWEQLTRLRGGLLAAASPRPGPTEALAALAADFRADSSDREAWGILHFHYFSGSSATRGQVATAVGVGYNTVRRRLERGHELLAAELRERERSVAMASERTHNVPRQPSRFIGREAELGAIRSLMANHRLVVLTGPGGIGKSRLAIHLAQDLAADYADGAWFVELAAAHDGHRVPQTVLAALGQRDIPGQTTLQTVTAILAEQRRLLVLDNCEQVVAECAALLEHLLRHCPALEILATSREALPLADAAHWLVPPMGLPAPHTPPGSGRLLHFDGPRLFNARAVVAAPGFALTEVNGGQVDRICAQLDGIPLALEMAAGRLGDLSLAELEAGLADRFRLLRDGRHASRPGHETLRATMDWSYDLLVEPEQRFFRRLAVFRGGCTVAAAEAACAGDGVDAAAVPLLLDCLAAKSLLFDRGEDGPQRYRMLETVRQYARDRLVEHGEAGHWRDRHLAYYEGLAGDMADWIFEPQRLEQSPEVFGDLDNYRAAMTRAGERPAAAAGARIASTLFPLWERLGLDVEAEDWLRGFLEVADGTWPPRVHAAALYVAGKLGTRRGDLAAATEQATRAGALFEAAGHVVGTAACDALVGHLLRRQGRRTEAVERLRAAREAFRSLGHRNGQADAAMRLATAIDKRESMPTALDLLTESEALYRELGYERGVAAVLANRGFVLMTRGRIAAAREPLEQSVPWWRSTGDTFNLSVALLNLGGIALNQGDIDSARRYLDESLYLAHRCGSRAQIGHCLASLADVAFADHDDEAAQGMATQAVEIGRRLGDTLLHGNALLILIGAELQQGRLAEANLHLAEGFQLADERGLTSIRCPFLAHEGTLRTLEGAYPAAHQAVARSIALARDLDIEHGLRMGLAAAIRLAAAEDQARRALTLAGAAEALRAANDIRLVAREAAELATTLSGPRVALGAAAAECALAIGELATVGEATAYALGDLSWEDLRDAVAARSGSAAAGPTAQDG